MTKTIKKIIIGIAVIGLATGIGIGLEQIKDSDQKENGKPELTLQEKIKAIEVEMEEKIKAERRTGCVAIHELKINPDAEPITAYGFCGESIAKVNQITKETSQKKALLQARPEKERNQTIQVIKNMREDQNLQVGLTDFSPNPYWEGEKMETYKDNEGMEYWVATENGQVIQFGVAPAMEGERMKEVDLTSKYSKAEVEKLAESFFKKNVEGFETIKARSTYTITNKDGIYFFRYDYSKNLEFIQVGITVAGEIIGFNNTIAY